MKTKLFIYLIFAPIVLLAQENSDTIMNGGIVYGNDHAFILTAPNGWVLDNSSGVSQGIQAVFYPIGRSWEYSNTVMYANTASKKVEGNETIEKVIEFDSENFKQRGAEVTKDSVIFLTDNNKRAILKYFDDKTYENYEVVAYIEEETIITLIVLSSRDKEEFIRSTPKFIELLNSYMFITKDVEINK